MGNSTNRKDAMNNATQYLVRRHQTWYVNIKVPKAIEHLAGKKVTRSTGTRDLREANRVKHAIIAKLHQEWGLLEKTLPDDERVINKGGLGVLEKFVNNSISMIRAGLKDADTLADEAHVMLDWYLESRRAAVGIDIETGDVRIPEAEVKAVKEILAPAWKPDELRLKEVIGLYLEDAKRKGILQTSIDTKKRRANQLLAWIKDIPVNKITVKHCLEYTKLVVGTSKNAYETKKDTLTEHAVFFKWMVSEGMVASNLFDGMKGKIAVSKRGVKKDDERRGFNEDEMTPILSKLTILNNNKLSVMTLVAMYTGCRSSEIAELKVADCHTDSLPYFEIIAGKSMAAVRHVPIHPLLKPLVADLVTDKKQPYLFDGLTKGGRDSKRNTAITGKHSWFLRHTMGMTDKSVVFHSYRKNFITCLDRAGVSTNVIKEIVGHENSDITTGLYSDGFELTKKTEAVGLVGYGAKVDGLARELIDKLIVN